MKSIVFVDGQNLYHGAKNAWMAGPGKSAYSWPSYDVEKLAATLVSQVTGNSLAQIRFYTGVPNPNQDAFWHGFWTNKLRYLMSKGVKVYRGRINDSGQEKGVDVSLAIDLIQLTHDQAYDRAIIVSQDWDFGPAVRLARHIATGQGRTVNFESAFCFEPGKTNQRGVPGTTWVHIDQKTYDSCNDPRDYRN